jgi:pyruvate dehydrogenase (quinone)
MLLGELITLRQLRLPVKLVVFSNGVLSFVELEMKAAGIVSIGTDLDNPGSAAIAWASGLLGLRVERAEDLETAVSAGFSHDGPALVDVRTARQELAMPPKVTVAVAKGFSLYATRTILSGGGDEILELARTNLRDLRAE